MITNSFQRRFFGTSATLLGLSAAVSHAQAPTPTPEPVAPNYNAYILTPPTLPSPRINGPKIYGQRPGRPFLYRVPATGNRPMQFSASGLPEGLQLDAATGQITGSVAKAGEYKVTLRARNSLGRTARPFKIIIGDRIALTPPMGWNSWNSWAGQVDADKVLRSARVLVSSGLVNHGWNYVNIDDTWQGVRSGPTKSLQANEKFPDMKGLCDTLHGMGLKAGIYSSPWITTYAMHQGGSSDTAEGVWTRAENGNEAHKRIGQYHFTDADAKQWADWGFDYLKYDWHTNDIPSANEMNQALLKSGRDVVFSLSNSAPFDKAAQWGTVSNVWRTTGDIVDLWGRAPSGWQHGFAEIGFGQDKWTPFSGPGHWNDPDMLVLGYVSLAQRMHYTRLTPDEQYTHITLWSLLAAPLLIGADLERLDPFTYSLLTNDEVLAVNQDSLAKQAKKVSGPEFVPPAAIGGRRRGAPAVDSSSAPAVPVAPTPTPAPTPAGLSDNPGGNALVYARPLDDGTQAVGLFNVGSKPMVVTAEFATLGLKGSQRVRDLWRQKDVGNFKGSYSAMVAPHGTVLVKIGKPRN